MWADAQRDGRPTEYRLRHLRKFHNSIPCTTPQRLAVPTQETTKDRAKFGWPPVSDVAAVSKPRREIG